MSAAGARAGWPDGARIVITGGNSGIGLETARALTRHGAHVVIACRNTARAAAAAGRVRAESPRGRIDVAELDLSSMASVRAFGSAWDGPLDVLINNAGVMAPPRQVRTVDGYELQFATNHLGHFVLTGLLLPSLLAAPAPRVVTVASIAHLGGDEGVVEADEPGRYHAQRAYRNSKLANLLFALELQRQADYHGLALRSLAAHPGVSATGLFSARDGMGANPVVRLVAPPFLRVFTQSARRGARAIIEATVGVNPPPYQGPQRFGETRGPVGPARLSALAQDEKLAHRLWQVSEDLTGFHYPWP
ncbi:MAG: SDR family NAD(P)-dependent oxidoreductase [Jatrophihabitans sp.]|nr:MAG: SDR family NAD(P)-dependent oxidoreductase [Jatrophihabitans sp.]